MQRGRLWQELYRSQYFEGGRVLAAAISAIDIAQHDIVGKALLLLADAPGLGVEVDEAALGEPFHPSEFPHLHRTDGSVTNW